MTSITSEDLLSDDCLNRGYFERFFLKGRRLGSGGYGRCVRYSDLFCMVSDMIVSLYVHIGLKAFSLVHMRSNLYQSALIVLFSCRGFMK